MADSSPAVVVEVTAVEVELPDLSTRVEWFEDWEESTRDARTEARLDRDYYDGKQWTREELDALKARKQPALVKNRIARKINFILGEEIKKRVDPCAKPRTPQHEDSARAATDALRFVEEEQRFDVARSSFVKNVLIEGYGGALKELEEDEDGDYKHRLRHVEWDRLAYDPHSRAPDFSDARWLAIVAWMDLDDAVAEYPDAAEALRSAVDNAVASTDDTTDDTPRGWSDRKRQRVKLVEMYFNVGREWFRCVFHKGADIKPPEKTWLLDEKRRHSLCPLKMASCYVDANGMRYGVVRCLRSPQDEINKRSSKALHLLSVRQVMYEDGAIPDPKKFQTELAKPDGMPMLGTGALSDGPSPRVLVNNTNDLAQGQITLLQEAKQDIDTIGPSSATMPDIPESASGRAFLARQQAASQELGTIFDQIRQWTHSIYEIDWLSIRLVWTEEKWLRVTDDQELTGYRFTALNQHMTRAERLKELLEKQAPLASALAAAAGEFAPVVMTEVQQAAQRLAAQAQQMGGQSSPPDQLVSALVLRHPLMQQPITVNQVDQMLVDIVIDEAPETAVLAEEQYGTLGEITPTVIQVQPQLAKVMVKAMIQASSLRNKREILAELDKAPDPAEQQAQQQAQQLQQAMAQAGVAVQQTKAQLQQAQTAKTQAEAQAIPAKTAAEVEAQQARTVESATRTGAASVPQGAF